MKQFFKISLVIMTVVLAFAACNKVDDLPHYNNGNSVTLTSSASAVTPTVADSNNVIVSFSWTNPNYAIDTANYKFTLEIDSAGGNFMQGTKKVINDGYTTGITGREMNNILLNYGFTPGQPYNLDIRVASSYANNNERYYSNTVSLSVSAFTDPSVLTSTVSSVVLTLPTANNPAGTFNWTPSFTGYTGAVTYSIEYDLAGAGFGGAINTIAVGSGILTKTLTEDEMNQTAINSGIVMGALGTVEYRVKAVTALGAISYSNTVNIQIQSYISILRFYMPGNYQVAGGYGTNDWEPTTAPQLIRDQRPGALNSQYYIYIYLPAGALFKFTQGQSWAINYGTPSAGVLELGNTNNLSVPTAGYYRITIDINTLTYDIREGRMGFVGGAVGPGWNLPAGPAVVFPDYKMGFTSTNLFVGVTDFIVDGWKLIDGDIWNNSTLSVDNVKSYGSPSPSGGSMEVNGGNFPSVAAPGKYRAIWDGRNVDNIIYQTMAADEMRIVGNGITGVNDWDPPTSPQMTYSGNGVWTITLALDANESFKFLAGNAWGAFDYEDQSGGSQVLVTPRKISFDSGGGDFKTPATAGTYTVTLDESTQTVTVN